MVLEQESIDVYLALDVGKTGHHAVALNRAGKNLYDEALPQDETKIRDVLTRLARHRKVLVAVDQPATISVLPVAVSQATGAAVGYLLGMAMRRIADLQPGQAKTDARDATIITEAARSIPHRCARWNSNMKPWPSSKCSAGSMTTSPDKSPPPPTGSADCSPNPHVKARLKKHTPRAPEVLAGAVFKALDQQSVVVVGAGAAGTALPKLAEQLLALRRQRYEIADQVEALVEAQPLYEVLTSMPGNGVRTCARILAEVTGKHFASAAHLASYAGVAPATRRSGTSIRGEHPSRRGNKPRCIIRSEGGLRPQTRRS